MGNEQDELVVEVKTLADTDLTDPRGGDSAATDGGARRRRGEPMRCPASGDSPP